VLDSRKCHRCNVWFVFGNFCSFKYFKLLSVDVCKEQNVARVEVGARGRANNLVHEPAIDTTLAPHVHVHYLLHVYLSVLE
jgi:hypothetical protein